MNAARMIANSIRAEIAQGFVVRSGMWGIEGPEYDSLPTDTCWRRTRDNSCLCPLACLVLQNPPPERTWSTHRAVAVILKRRTAWALGFTHGFDDSGQYYTGTDPEAVRHYLRGYQLGQLFRRRYHAGEFDR